MLPTLGQHIAQRRKALHLSQTALAQRASIGYSTLQALESGRLPELGFTKITRILSALGLELALQPTLSRRPTLEELMQEQTHDQGLDRRL
jgi:transcriptional regulator with XRE-family HTH domain